VIRETKCLYAVRDPNLARIVGVCSPDEPLCVVQEYCEFGDLPRFLKLQTAGTAEARPTIKYVPAGFAFASPYAARSDDNHTLTTTGKTVFSLAVTVACCTSPRRSRRA